MEFAIVDIETTGGHASANGITEVAIYIHNGAEVTEKFEQLINPNQPIPYFISSLTGITDSMVADAPAFEHVAQTIYDLLANRVFVAHNVNFDYTFIKHYLGRCGLELNTKKLCTVRLSRKILPGMASYSLGKLCAGLNIANNSRHRAGGDAAATAELFTLLYSTDTEGHITAMLKQGSKEQMLPPNLDREKVVNLPYCAGVYYFKNRKGKVIYVGKARNIKYRVTSHFTGTNIKPQRQHFLREIYDIDYVECGNELMALLLEYKEIKRLWPAYNSALKRFEPKVDLFMYEDQRGYLRLGLDKHNKNLPGVITFRTISEGHSFLTALVDDYALCGKMSGYVKHAEFCSGAFAEGGKCACNQKLAPAEYNNRVTRAIEQWLDNQPSYVIVDKGRRNDEQSCLYVEKGTFYGMGYVDAAAQLNTLDDIKGSLERYPSNSYVMSVLETFCRKFPSLVRRLDNFGNMPAGKDEALAWQ